MPNINETKFGSITVDNKKYKQVLIIDKKVIERNDKKLHDEFGTTHYICNDEKKLLLSQNPEVIIIGTGVSGALKTFPEFDLEINKLGIKLIKERTLSAIKKYNKLSKTGKKVNALIHTTC